jgi:hypothetical protein
MTEGYNGIRIIPGTTETLIVAPHGPIIDGEYQNDLRTGVIAEEIHRRLGCYTIINDLFFKPKGKIKKSLENSFLDLFRIDHAQKVRGYTDRIKEVSTNGGKTLVVWVHGIADDVAVSKGQAHCERGLFRNKPTELHALIGFGQGGDPKTGEEQNRYTAQQKTVEGLRDLLTSGGMNTLLTHKECSNFRGRDSKRLNQWFIQLGYDFDTVESVQLEIKELGFRDSKTSAIITGEIIAKALKNLVRRSPRF